MDSKKLIYGFIAVSGLVFTACSNIDEDDRLIYVKPAEVSRAVLVEDFTGQRCVNCPNATVEIESLIEQYGADNVIAVGIHSGPLGFDGSATVLGLKTAVGDEYFAHWGASFQPVGLVNRRGGLKLFTDWGKAVYDEVQKTAPLSIEVENSYNADSRELTIHTSYSGTEGNTTGKLQLWITEDNITAMQMMPDNTANANYVHNHVFRAAVNGTWGEDVTVTEGVTVNKSHIFSVPADWKAENLSVVAFVYNDDGVQQVTKKRVIELSEDIENNN